MAEREPGALNNDTEQTALQPIEAEVQSTALVRIERGPRFSDLAGLDEPIRRLKDVATIILNPQQAEEHDVRVPHGILVRGPEGVGKTQLVRAFTRNIHAELLNVNVSDVLGGHVGDPNTKLKKIFASARTRKNTVVVFFDEIDGLMSTNAGGNGGVNTSLVAEFKTIMSGLQTQQPNTIVVGCTNKLDGFDSALLRPGRFDVIIDIPLPDLESRQSIFGSYISRRSELYKIGGADGSTPEADILNINALANAAEGMTGADIESILQTARASRLVAHLERHEPVSRVTQTDVQRAIDLHKRSRSN